MVYLASDKSGDKSSPKPPESTPKHVSAYNRSIKERIFHGLLFEMLAILLATPIAAWLTNQSLSHMGILSAVISFIALIWNMLFNWGFDQIQMRLQFKRNLFIRMAHACMFEIGLIVFSVPFIAWWINTSMLHALILDIGLILFFLPYSFFFNLIYDRTRARILNKRTV